ncbi:SDR family NAD(P)-dependent oxidoreductase [Tengunoibacter tsumagoiensis]|uniref:3-ketoacyl-ACP reductase n=1 Tax=Tengunoibacter tsumagoiensis TaxID=2014871 RepID=A0A402A1D7_9CHLR|nr:glucose 1-dehydrogenase [Tengunoibacter tsumagoiensis]GCE12958.1 3-ketoacyl-ACP reductase [Tengunoibacter tsumagoiensis]
MKRLADKVAVVTGSSRGIGRSIAQKLAQEGAKVVVNYSSKPDEAQKVVQAIQQQGGDAIALQADMGQIPQIIQLMDKVIETYQRLDILVSNAGIEHFGAFDTVTPEDFDRIFAVNTRGQFFAMQQAARHMNNGGRIICTSSISASKGFLNHAVYSGSKAANEGFARSLAIDLGPRGITVNAIAPGATQTSMYDKNVELYGDPDSRLSLDDQMKKFSPLGRIGQPEDIANVVAFLVSDEAGWLTGQVIHITGGMA